MILSRRDLLAGGLKGCTLLASGLTIPRFLSRSALAMGGPDPDGRILVVLQLTGGNDGLNTLVPYRDDEYYKARPAIAVPRGQVLSLTDDLGVPPQMRGIKDLFDQGWLSVVQGVGYPNPNRSHFESMDIWHTCCAEAAKRDGTGWLGRTLETLTAPAANRSAPAGDLSAPAAAMAATLPAIHVDGTDLPLALAARGVAVPTIDNPNDFKLDMLDPGSGRSADALRRLAAPSTAASKSTPGAKSDDLMFIQRTMLTACDQAEQLATAAKAGSGGDYPNYGLGEHLRLIANLIHAGVGARIYYTSLSGFDTHAKQKNHHAQLLSQVSQSIKAFFDDLRARGLADRVLLMTFSEFGRRVHENYSEGTDHGAAAPMLLVGPGVQGGIHGGKPGLTDLDDGDLRMATDFRSVYAAVLENWLRVGSDTILGGRYASVAALR